MLCKPKNGLSLLLLVLKHILPNSLSRRKVQFFLQEKMSVIYMLIIKFLLVCEGIKECVKTEKMRTMGKGRK